MGRDGRAAPSDPSEKRGHTPSASSPTGPQSILPWLTLLYGPEPWPGHLVLWTRQDRRSHWFSGLRLDAMATTAQRLAASRDVYAGVGVQYRQLGPRARGAADTVCAIPGLWLDLDVASPAHQAESLPPSHEAAMDLLDDFPLEPSAVIDSGHGLQAWWLFAPGLWRFDYRKVAGRVQVDDHQAATDLSRRFQAHLIALGARRGWHVDATHDLARVLRLPGTFNRKLDPRPVQVLTLDPQRRYRPAQIAAALPEPKPASRPPVAAPPAAAGGARYWVAALEGELRRLEQVTACREVELHRSACRLGQLVPTGAPEGTLREALVAAGYAMGLDPGEPEHATTRGLAWGAAHPRGAVA